MLSGSSFFTWFMVIALLGVWTSVAVIWFELVDYEEVLGKNFDIISYVNLSACKWHTWVIVKIYQLLFLMLISVAFRLFSVEKRMLSGLPWKLAFQLLWTWAIVFLKGFRLYIYHIGKSNPTVVTLTPSSTLISILFCYIMNFKNTGTCHWIYLRIH